MTPYPEYIQLKDIYCILYLGDDKRILNELEFLRPIVSMQYGLDIKIMLKKTETRFAGVSVIKDADSFRCFLEENDLPIPKFLKEETYITQKTEITI